MKSKSRLSRLAAIVSAVVLFTAGGVCPAAADEWINLDAKGSISITMHDGNNKAVGGGEMTIYQVASVNVENGADLSFVLTNGFEGGAVTNENLKKPDDSTLAAKLEKQITATAKSEKKTIGIDGKVSFSNLDLGLYLLVENKAADGYNKVASFLVSVPYQEKGSYVYDVNATPKVEAETAVPTTTPAPTVTPTTDSNLPQTGQLDWPIPLLAGGGVLLFALGFFLNKDWHKEEA